MNRPFPSPAASPDHVGPARQSLAPVEAGRQFGPITTSRMTGAGGPFNDWDCKIASALRRGNPMLAKRLQEARARVNLSFCHQEPVWVPTEAQLAIGMMLRVAGDKGICTVPAETPFDDDLGTSMNLVAPLPAGWVRVEL